MLIEISADPMHFFLGYHTSIGCYKRWIHRVDLKFLSYRQIVRFNMKIFIIFCILLAVAAAAPRHSARPDRFDGGSSANASADSKAVANGGGFGGGAANANAASNAVANGGGRGGGAANANASSQAIAESNNRSGGAANANASSSAVSNASGNRGGSANASSSSSAIANGK